MNVYVHIFLVVKRSFALLEIPKTALSKLFYLHSTVLCADTNLDPKRSTHTPVQPCTQTI